jgi:hypothetical protein
MTARESVDAKARRYLAEGRLVVLQVDGDSIAAECRGSPLRSPTIPPSRLLPIAIPLCDAASVRRTGTTS